MGNTQKKFRTGKGAGASASGKKGANANTGSGKSGRPAPAQSLASDGDANETVELLLKKGPISAKYNVDYNVVLGRGHYATVNLGTHKESGMQVAVKRIQISKSRVEALKREVEVLRKVGRHPNIVTLYDIFITDTELILVLELLTGGELFDRMVEKGPYSEQEASHHIRKIGQALKFLHRAGIVHRDLKPENLLLAHKGNDSELKIADFGLANVVDNVENATMRTVCGTWAYCAPEVKTTMQEEGGPACYTAKVDLWSVGVILFVVLGAYHPFDPDGDASDAQLWSNICKGEFDFDDPAWDHISMQAKDLIKRLIVVDPSKRYDTDQLLNHPWVKQMASVPATPITPNIDRSLTDYNGKRKSKKGIVAAVKRMNPLANSGGGSTTPQMHHQQHQQHQQMHHHQQQQQQMHQQHQQNDHLYLPPMDSHQQQMMQQQQHQQQMMHAQAQAASGMHHGGSDGDIHHHQQHYHQQQADMHYHHNPHVSSQHQQQLDYEQQLYEASIAAAAAEQFAMQPPEMDRPHVHFVEPTLSNGTEVNSAQGGAHNGSHSAGYAPDSMMSPDHAMHDHGQDDLPKLTLNTLMNGDSRHTPSTMMELETPVGQH
ncbi:Protein kinase, putative [Hondaea fermentalgiana]|uniref:Protein kinase, putative n=1 Tax=Hondaea fermentalgiana TaxID=2315210 RepID=A0A2R5GTL3_9STRA|nr:Protein kinase, putative [Hondaea fermentalgiana]|eukprot:GBG33915.1 Protein kinase, putative [Hondaea fermentalgiana]